jgi:hypothetical protein
MRVAWTVLLGATLFLFFLVAGARADDKKVTLKGQIACAHCELKLDGIKKCTTAIVVKVDGKDVTYLFDDKGAKEEYHEPVCGGGRKDGTVIGIVSEKDGKKYIKPEKVEYAKK